MNIEHFIKMSQHQKTIRAGSVGAAGDDTSSTGTTVMWVVVGAALGVAGTLAVQTYLPTGKGTRAVAAPPAALPKHGFEPGWYVLLYEEVSNPRFKGKGKLKERSARLGNKAQAEASAKVYRDNGWTKADDAKAVVKNLTKDVF